MEQVVHAVMPEVFRGTSNRMRHAVAVLRGTSHVGIVAFGERAGQPSAFVYLDHAGGATEYVPFDGVTRPVEISVACLSPGDLRLRISRDGADDELFVLSSVDTLDLPRETPAGQYAGRVEACQEAGPLKVSITAGETPGAGWQLSARVPGNCSVQASVAPCDAPGCHAVAVRIAGPRGCSLNGRTLNGELAMVGGQVLLTVRNDTGGLLYMGARAPA